MLTRIDTLTSEYNGHKIISIRYKGFTGDKFKIKAYVNDNKVYESSRSIDVDELDSEILKASRLIDKYC